MNQQKSWTPTEMWQALDQARARLEQERRGQFAVFGIDADCLWPCSRLFHQQSSLGPAWRPALTVSEVEVLTKNRGYRGYPGTPRTPLPNPPALKASLEETIWSRRSRSDFSDRPLSMEMLAKMLQLGCGVTALDEVPRRAAPSGGALFPVEAYPLVFHVNGLACAAYHYLPLAHALEKVVPLAGFEATASFLPPGLFAAKPVLVIALSVVFERTQRKYLERGYRFALLEAGHIAQNLVLTACALGLNAVPVGGFWDEPFNELLRLNPLEEAVVYSVLVGHRPGDDEQEIAQ